MIRNDRLAALNELHASCIAAAERYREAANLSTDAEDREAFQRLAGERLSMAADIALRIRRAGDMPDLPDADRSALEEAVTVLHAWIAHDSPGALRSDASETDLGMAEQAAAALDLFADDADTQKLLGRVRDSAEKAVRMLRTRGKP